MFIERIGSSLESCSQGYLYKVVGTNKSLVSFINNNGEVNTARLNSDKWNFKPTNISLGRIGSNESLYLESIRKPSTVVNNNHTSGNNTRNQYTSNNSAGDSLVYGAIALSLLG